MPDKTQQQLRMRAEKKLWEMDKIFSQVSADEIKHIVHELHVHQIELEMQNEELRRVQLEIEEQRDKLADLYDFAPVGYFTLSKKGIILEANLTACSLLKTDRTQLLKTQFSQYVHKDDQDVYYQHKKRLGRPGEPTECEIRLITREKEFFWIRLVAAANTLKNQTEQNIRLSFHDITVYKQA